MKCRSCGEDSFGDVIDLGSMPLVNNLLWSPADRCECWPLKVIFCRACSLAQLSESPSPRSMFDEYVYFSSQSRTVMNHAARLVKRFVQPRSKVVEIASNDGYLLKQAQARGATVLGVDPARNIAAYANEHGVPTRCEYFDARTAKAMAQEFGRADVIFANNVLAHVPDPNQIVAGIKLLLAEDGSAHIEVPSLMAMIESRAFDTIYHEHQCYFSLSALKSLFNRHGLHVVAVELLDIHGGSFHLTVAHTGNEAAAERVIENETLRGMFEDRYYADFASRVDRLREQLHEALAQFGAVVGFGAAAKGVVLLNAFEIGVDRLPWVADVSPYKQGKFIPGTGQAIVAPSQLLEQQPDAALILPWNIRDEIVLRNRQFLDRGGRFVVANPRVEVIESSMAPA